jgi:AAHS family 4-hydroxybenzoate transporter-like MFS transporter
MHAETASARQEGTPRTSALVDVNRVLEERPWGSVQVLVMVLTAFTVIIDGVDGQLLGIAIPAIMADWKVARSAFAPVLAAGFVGMMIGGAVAGIVGDRWGRRFALACSVIVFGLATIGASMTNDLLTLGVLRFIAGFGLQGAVPNAAALVSEYVPLRHRALAVTLTIVCFPLGAALAGLLAIPVLPVLGWRVLFVIGGFIPLAVAVVLLRYLPESPRFLVRRPARWSELTRILQRLGYAPEPDARFVDLGDKTVTRPSIREVLISSSPLDTLGLWSASFFCMLAVYSGFNWIPSMLSGAGLDLTVANVGITAYNLGGVVGALSGGLAITRFGSKLTMVTFSGGAVAMALVMRAMTINAESSTLPIIVMLGLIGALINAIQVTMYALAAHIYPTTVRATGVGTTTGVGRIGAILSTYAGAWALEAGGNASFFTLVATAMLIVMGSLALIRRHIPGMLTVRTDENKSPGDQEINMSSARAGADDPRVSSEP